MKIRNLGLHMHVGHDQKPVRPNSGFPSSKAGPSSLVSTKAVLKACSDLEVPGALEGWEKKQI